MKKTVVIRISLSILLLRFQYSCYSSSLFHYNKHLIILSNHLPLVLTQHLYPYHLLLFDLFLLLLFIFLTLTPPLLWPCFYYFCFNFNIFAIKNAYWNYFEPSNACLFYFSPHQPVLQLQTPTGYPTILYWN